MKHHSRCLERRLRLWLTSPVKVVQVSPHAFEISGSETVLGLEFEPRTCSWTLRTASGSETGDFDRLTKRVRQLLTISSKLEEEG